MESSKRLLVPVFKGGVSWERGILAVDDTGVSYRSLGVFSLGKPILALLVVVLLGFNVGGPVMSVSLGFMPTLLINLCLAFGAMGMLTIVGGQARQAVEGREREIAAGGQLPAASDAPGWSYGWGNLAAVRVVTGKSAAVQSVQVASTDGGAHAFSLFPSPTFSLPDAQAAAEAIRSSLKAHAQERLLEGGKP